MRTVRAMSEPLVEEVRTAVGTMSEGELVELAVIVAEERKRRDEQNRAMEALREAAATDEATAEVAQEIAEKRLAEAGREPGGAWVRPTGAHDAYPLGWRVTHAGTEWESAMAFNTLEPGAQGRAWLPTDVVDGGAYEPWVQPLGAHDAYPDGAVVTYEGQLWRSTIAANVWAPGVHGWELVEEQTDPEPEAPVPDGDEDQDETEDDEDEPGPGPAPSLPAWASGVHYSPGDRVTHDGATWEAIIDHTSHIGWAPGPATYAVWKAA